MIIIRNIRSYSGYQFEISHLQVPYNERGILWHNWLSNIIFPLVDGEDNDTLLYTINNKVSLSICVYGGKTVNTAYIHVRLKR